MAEMQVTFDDADAYERFMGRWSRAIGEKFLAWLAPSQNARWLEVGCGTGAFTSLVLERCAPASVNAIDPSPQQVEYARKAFPSVSFQISDSMSLPFGDREFDYVSSALVLHFIADRGKAFSEMQRVAKVGGVVSGYTWERSATTNSAPYAPMTRGLKALGIDPMQSPTVPEASPDGLRQSLERAGYGDIEITVIDASQAYRDFEEFWQAQTVTFHPVGRTVATLDEAQRAELRAIMREMLPAGRGGEIRHSVRATAFKARSPS